jgi:hypothetical protein
MILSLEELTQRILLLEREVHELSNTLTTLSALVYRLEGRINTVTAVGSSVPTLPNIRYKVKN